MGDLFSVESRKQSGAAGATGPAGPAGNAYESVVMDTAFAEGQAIRRKANNHGEVATGNDAASCTGVIGVAGNAGMSGGTAQVYKSGSAGVAIAGLPSGDLYRDAAGDLVTYATLSAGALVTDQTNYMGFSTGTLLDVSVGVGQGVL